MRMNSRPHFCVIVRVRKRDCHSGNQLEGVHLQEPPELVQRYNAFAASAGLELADPQKQQKAKEEQQQSQTASASDAAAEAPANAGEAGKNTETQG